MIHSNIVNIKPINKYMDAFIIEAGYENPYENDIDAYLKYPRLSIKWVHNTMYHNVLFICF